MLRLARIDLSSAVPLGAQARNCWVRLYINGAVKLLLSAWWDRNCPFFNFALKGTAALLVRSVASSPRATQDRWLLMCNTIITVIMIHVRLISKWLFLQC